MINLTIDFEWNSVLENKSDQYVFPNIVTDYMRQKYRMPAIYRWIVDSDGMIESIYIGETVELCPRRVYGYLNPGPSQMTNIRINNLFDELIKRGKIIRLEYLVFSDFLFDGKKITDQDLIKKNIRVLLENIMITHHENAGVVILNQAINSKV
ncbi:MAG: hypothetical protein K8Q89_10995 [Nitrosarchaeum sp.]|nr:hypothetical protein [Nitrosarchaeum sp.]